MTGRDVADSVRGVLGNGAGCCIVEQGGVFMVDLKEANRLLLSRAGLSDISVSDECTSCRNDKYWSHRFTNGERGSQAAMICMKGAYPC